MCFPMKSTTKYVLYILAVVVMIALLFYMRDNISLWLSHMGTYVIILGATFFAGWLLGRVGSRNTYKARIAELQARIAELEK